VSHEIDGDRAIYARDPAWHGLGVVKMDGWMTADECLLALNPSDELVRKVPAYAKVLIPVGDGTFKEVLVESSEKMALVERDPDHMDLNADDPMAWRMLSFMDKDYGLVQLHDQFRFLDEVVGQIGGAHYTAAARLRKGKQTVVTIQMDQVALDPNGIDDRIDKYLWGSNSFDGSWAFRVKPLPFRVECANMAAAGLRHNSLVEWSTKHTRNIMDRTRAAAQVLGFQNEYFEEWISEAEMMMQTPLHDDALTRILNGLFETKDAPEPLTERDRQSIGDVRTVYELSPAQVKLRGTVWGGYNALVEWSDWVYKPRKTQGFAEARVRRQIGETDKGLKQAAWEAFYGYAMENPRPVVVAV